MWLYVSLPQPSAEPLDEGSCCWGHPISVFLLPWRAAYEVVNSENSSEAFAAVAAGLTGVATFVGLIIGGVLLHIGLILSLGGRREVIVVEGNSRHESNV